MLKKKIKMLIVKTILGIVLVASIFLGGGVGVKTYAINYDNPQIEQTQKESYDVLIYNSHTHEAYEDTNVVEMGEDLKIKLEKKGFKVKHITEEFDNNYNMSYFKSRDMLKKELKNNTYRLIIDYHRDAIEGKVVGKDNNNSETSKLMFVETTASPNFEPSDRIVKEMKENLDKFGDITRKTWQYRKGINYYNGDLSDKLILIENGFNTNTKLELKKSNTYLSSAIEQYLNNN